jgi:hypothetical protein
LAEREALLKDIGTLLSRSFGDAIVWEQRDSDLVGKYVYVKYAGKELGIFLGCQLNESGSIKGGITFFFAHPASAREEAKELVRLFHRLLIRLNLKLQSNPYTFIPGKSPAIMRLKSIRGMEKGDETCRTFFEESVHAIKHCEPIYRTASI